MSELTEMEMAAAELKELDAESKANYESHFYANGISSDLFQFMLLIWQYPEWLDHLLKQKYEWKEKDDKYRLGIKF